MHQANDPESSENSIEMVNYMLSNAPPQTQISLDKLSFADVMQFAEFGPKLTLNQSKVSSDEDSYLLKLHDEPLLLPPPPPPPPAAAAGEEKFQGMAVPEDLGEILKKVESDRKPGGGEAKNRRKRPRAMKTNEEVESQRMTHIAVERNRRRQMNEHLRVLRSLMPGSYVQRGDQASIIGGAIEFVRELEQLLQCLESQKRRRLFGRELEQHPQCLESQQRRRLFGNSGEAPRAILDGPPVAQQPPPAPLYPPGLPFPTSNIDQIKLLDIDPGGGGGSAMREEMAENKSCLADIEVRVVGFDAMIKILSRRRPGQLIKTIAALEDMQFVILHTNITTIEQTVLYSFNVKIACETRWTAEDIANSVQQILSYIDANTV